MSTTQHDEGDGAEATEETEAFGAVERPSDVKQSQERTWGASVTSVIAPTAETAAAVDPLQHVHDAKREDGSAIERAIAAVAERHLGTGSREEIKDALRRELEACGHWPQPEPWLDAVATDMAGGEVYRMGTD